MYILLNSKLEELDDEYGFVFNSPPPYNWYSIHHNKRLYHTGYLWNPQESLSKAQECAIEFIEKEIEKYEQIQTFH